jgi:phosphoribosylaminoimidazole-succinocarboxamide synthase
MTPTDTATDTSNDCVLQSDCPTLDLIARGKVRDLYQVDQSTLLFVATDRLSAFDVVMKNGIPQKGLILAQLSAFWFDFLKDIVPNHFITMDIRRMPPAVQRFQGHLAGRGMMVKKLKVLPIEAIVRGYLAGSGWSEYKSKGTICNISLPTGMVEAQKLPCPLFTPSTKADLGAHGEPVLTI